MLLECPVSGDEITRKIAGGFGQQEFAIYDVLRRAQSEGSFDSSVDARRSRQADTVLLHAAQETPRFGQPSYSNRLARMTY